jgi:hypothetical protein
MLTFDKHLQLALDLVEGFAIALWGGLGAPASPRLAAPKPLGTGELT